MKIFSSVLLAGLCAFSFQSQVQAQELSLNDISILLPLPKDLKNDLLPQPLTKGAFGELLPQDFYQELPDISADEESEVTWDRLRVVAIRIDPCFPSAATQARCLRQIRFVWQPLEFVFGQGVFAQDAAVHTFYEIPDQDFAELLKDIKSLKKSFKIPNDLGPLNVHPVLASQGLDGKFGKKLLARILKSVGRERFTRMTFTQATGGGNIWIFGGFDLVDGALKDMRIPRTEKIRQGFFNHLNASDRFVAGGILPSPDGPDQFNLLVSDSSLITKDDEAQIIEGAVSAIRIENPNFHNPNTVDCASCHLTQPARIFAVKNFPHLNLEEKMEPFRFKSNFDLTNTSPNQWNTNRVRAFGYEGNGTAISQRVINETAATLTALAAVNE